MKYDLIVIGGGSAAFAAALKAVELGTEKIAIIEKGPAGGTCVNRGCIPTKSLLRAGEIFHNSQQSGYMGINLNGSLNLTELIYQKDLLVRNLRKKKYLDIIKATPQIELIRGRAEFVSSDLIKVGSKKLGAARLIIATGARPAVPHIEGLSDLPFLTSTEALNVTTLPESITIIGGRYVALEFAQMFRHFGSEVTVLQRSPRIIPDEEDEISVEMELLLLREGIKVQTGTSITGVQKNDSGAVIYFKAGNRGKSTYSESLMMATGITANNELNLEAAGIEKDERGFVIVDSSLQTTAENVWAAGDITGRLPLLTVAAHQGATAAENAVTGAGINVDYSAVPHAIFTSPQIASVGLTEREAVQKGYDCTCRTLPMEHVPRAKAVHDTRGLIKMVADGTSGRVLGIHILAPEASEVIHQGVLMIKNNMTVKDILDKIDVYPTMSEMIKLCAQSFTKDIRMLSCCAE